MYFLDKIIYLMRYAQSYSEFTIKQSKHKTHLNYLLAAASILNC